MDNARGSQRHFSPAGIAAVSPRRRGIGHAVDEISDVAARTENGLVKRARDVTVERRRHVIIGAAR